jgi:hypothetical protein
MHELFDVLAAIVVAVVIVGGVICVVGIGLWAWACVWPMLRGRQK